jgi:hypothetical protein
MKNKKTYLIGGGIIALAVLIVLLAVLLPTAIHKNKMEKLLGAASSSVQLSVRDPLFETGDILGNRGKEVLVSGERLTELQTSLKGLSEAGFRAQGVQKMPGGAMVMNVKALTETGEIVILYFEEERFYYMDDGSAISFEAKDRTTYQAIYQLLTDCLKDK